VIDGEFPDGGQAQPGTQRAFVHLLAHGGNDLIDERGGAVGIQANQGHTRAPLKKKAKKTLIYSAIARWRPREGWFSRPSGLLPATAFGLVAKGNGARKDET
jgi:hypothetical protein